MKNRPAKLLLVSTVFGFSVLSAAAFIIFDALILEPNWVTVRRVTVRSPRLAAALDDVRVVQISDLHLQGPPGFRERMLVRRLNRLHPDLVLVTGDLVESGEASPLVEDFFRRIHPRLWSYGVLGNSDKVFLRGDAFRKDWRRAGLSLLGGKAIRMKPGKRPFWLAGIDFPGYGNVDLTDPLDRLFAEIDSGDPVIFLSYSPGLAPQLAERGADLILSGDTHGGQVTFPGWAGLFRGLGRSRFIRGLYRLGDAFLYVNRGIATKKLPVRFLCPPEITVFHFVD